MQQGTIYSFLFQSIFLATAFIVTKTEAPVKRKLAFIGTIQVKGGRNNQNRHFTMPYS
jgi:hypothetical protein